MNILALLTGLLSGIIGAMGLGGGAVLVIYLTLFTDTKQLKAQGINLFFFLPIAFIAVTVYAFKKEIKWKKILPVALGGILGAFGGIFLAQFIGGKLLPKLFGGGLILLGIKEIMCLKKGKKGGIIKKE
jgi:uncharacterized membrane protein YfcA